MTDGSPTFVGRRMLQEERGKLVELKEISKLIRIDNKATMKMWIKGEIY